jgi:hypothetical protein
MSAEQIIRLQRINGILPSGLVVGCRYRWPQSSSHPDCWEVPHKGIVLALDDVRAWKNTLAFPELSWPDGPIQEYVTEHVQKHLDLGHWKKEVPVLYTAADGDEFMQWDTQLLPYDQELTAWEEARAAARARL